MKLEGFCMDTISLAGSLDDKLAAMREAGFSRVMLSARDVVGHPGGLAPAAQVLRTCGLRPTGFQVLRDFEGLTGHMHAYKVDIAKAMIQTCAELGSKLLLACSSVSAHASEDRSHLARDLAKLAMLALPYGIRIAYEALSWGRTVNDFMQAWDIVAEADCPNLGLGIDSFHVLAAGSALDDLDILDPWKIYLVQLSDFMWEQVRTPEERLATARHFRVFPGEGAHTEKLAELVSALDGIGYRGDYSFKVFNDDYRQLPLPVVAQRARKSALWLAEDVLRRSTPLPHRITLREVDGG